MRVTHAVLAAAAVAASTSALAMPATDRAASSSSSSLTDPASIASSSSELTTKKGKGRIILIRHGEKPKSGEAGLNELGAKRAKCLQRVFGAKSEFDVGLIMAQQFKEETKSRSRPYLTVKGLAKDLRMKVDIGCDRDDSKCVAKRVAKFLKSAEGKKGKDIVICWKHSNLLMLAQALGVNTHEPYPDDRYDLMWEVKDGKMLSKRSERCPGIDDNRKLVEDLEEGEEELVFESADEESVSDRLVPSEGDSMFRMQVHGGMGTPYDPEEDDGIVFSRDP